MFRRPLLHTLLGILAPVVGAQAANKVCDLCRDQIQGKYMSYRIFGRTIDVCAKCEQSKPRCAACNVPHNTQQLRLHKGERLCSVCLSKAEYCYMCDDRITGRYLSFGKGKEKKNYCTSCFNNNPKCPACGVPHTKRELARESGLCKSCDSTLQSCGACGEPVFGKFYKYEFSDEVFCNNCHSNKPHCYTCSLPVGKTYWEFQDGREICEKCNSRSVIDSKKIEAIMEESKKLVHKYVGIQALEPFTLHVEPLNAKSSVSAGRAKTGKTEESPLYGAELGLYRYKDGKSEIFLLYGLPIEMIYETAAHEYAHAWQTENVPPNQSVELKEGFAQWVGAKILQVKGYREALKRLEARRDRPYGTGYHKMKAIENRYGRKAVIDYVKTNTR